MWNMDAIYAKDSNYLELKLATNALRERCEEATKTDAAPSWRD